MSIRTDYLTAHQVVAHRGYQLRYPENTLLSVQKALDAGALHIEVDVQFSGDLVPMLYHDDSLERVSGSEGKLKDFSADTLQTFPAHEPDRFDKKFIDEKIASLESLTHLIAKHPSVTFYIELKEQAVRDHGCAFCLEKLFEVLAPVIEQCVLISFDKSALAGAAAKGFKRTGLVSKNWEARYDDYEKLGIDVLFINKKRLSIGKINSETVVAPCPVVVYEVGRVEEAHQLLARGVDRVESFAVGNLIEK